MRQSHNSRDTGSSIVLLGSCRFVETLSTLLLTQAMPVASIWHVGAHAAPNLSSDDWLQDWKVLGSGQDAAENRQTGQVDWGVTEWCRGFSTGPHGRPLICTYQRTSRLAADSSGAH